MQPKQKAGHNKKRSIQVIPIRWENICHVSTFISSLCFLGGSFNLISELYGDKKCRNSTIIFLYFESSLPEMNLNGEHGH